MASRNPRMPPKTLNIYGYCNLYQNQFSTLTNKSEKRWSGNWVTFYDFSTKVS